MFENNMKHEIEKVRFNSIFECSAKVYIDNIFGE